MERNKQKPQHSKAAGGGPMKAAQQGAGRNKVAPQRPTTHKPQVNQSHPSRPNHPPRPNHQSGPSHHLGPNHPPRPGHHPGPDRNHRHHDYHDDYRRPRKQSLGSSIMSWIIVIIIVIVILIVVLSQKSSANGETAAVRLDGNVILEMALNEDMQVPIQSKEGYNIVQVKEGTANVIEADCRDQICVQHAGISKKGETIVCLPHKLVVEIL